MNEDCFIPFAKPCLGSEEIEAVTRCLRSGWLTTGPVTKEFESEFARFLGAKHALSCSSATAGLHLALEACGVGPGDQVITTPYTFTATAEVMRYLSAHPLFVDIDRQTMNIDPVGVEQAVKTGTRVKAILPVHFAGQACDMGPILTVAKEHGLIVVEDAAHAFPTTWRGRSVGTIGDLTVFSFYATKTLAIGEGGMVVTDDAHLAKRIRTMRLHGINRDVFDRYTVRAARWFYEVVAAGFKYNLTDVASAIGLEQLRKSRTFLARRQAIAAAYSEGLGDLPLTTPYQADPGATHAWHLYVVQLALERLRIGRDEFIEMMGDAGVGTSVHFIPLHIQPYWRDLYGLLPEDFPVALDVYKRAVSLPIYPSMTDSDVCRVIDTIRSILIDYTK